MNKTVTLLVIMSKGEGIKPIKEVGNNACQEGKHKMHYCRSRRYGIKLTKGKSD